MINVGVIGVGMIGQDHIRRLTHVLTGCKVAAVADMDTERAAEVARSVDAEVFATGEELIASPNVDAVVVTSWGPTHEQYVLAAIANEKPVFCEKPLATTQEACLRIIEAEVKLGRRLVQVGFMRRFDLAYQQMRNAIDANEIGAPLMFHSTHRNPSVPDHYTSDMAIVDTAVHDIDTARWLLNDEIVSVQVRIPKSNSRGRKDLNDPLMTIMQTASGCLVDIETSVNIDYGYDIRGEVVGESGTLSLGERNSIIKRSAGRFSGSVCEDWRERFIAAFDEEFRGWLIAAAQGTATGPSSWDGYAAQAVCDAGLKALESGEIVPVELVEKPTLYN